MSPLDQRFYITGGNVPPDALSYVPRHADDALYEQLALGEFCYILTSRQMGKSSLMAHTVSRFRAEGIAVAVLDLSAQGYELEAEQWYNGLLIELGRRLNVEDEVTDCCLENERLSPLQLWQRTLRDVILKRIQGPIVVFIDEIDVVRSLPFSTDEFFAAIRACYNARTEDPAYRRLTFCLLGVATPADLIRNARLTPFNIGTRIHLTDFTREEAAHLQSGLGHDIGTNLRLMTRIYHWTGGHPCLTQRLCKVVAEEGAVLTEAGVDRCCRHLFFTPRAGRQDDNLTYVRQRMLDQDDRAPLPYGAEVPIDQVRREGEVASLLTLYAHVLAGKRAADREADTLVSRLKLSGVVRADNGLLQVRNRIYTRVFDRTWVRAQMPDAERRRQRAAFIRGVLRTASVGAVLLAIVGGLAVDALYQTGRANRAARDASEHANRADDIAYVAQMNLIQRDWEINVPRAVQLLEETRTSRFRGFEWGYWHRLSHLDRMTLQGHRANVVSVAFSPDGRRIVTGSWDGAINVWEAQTGQRLRPLLADDQKYLPPLPGGHAIAFAMNGKHLLTSSPDETVRVWDAATGKKLRTIQLPQSASPMVSAAFSRDGSRIATGHYDGTVRIRDVTTGQTVYTLRGHRAGSHVEGLNYEGALCLAFSQDDKQIASGGSDRTARVWDAETGQEILTLNQRTSPVLAVAFSPDGKRLVTGCEDGTVAVWDRFSGRRIQSLTGHRDAVTSVAFSLDGRRIATGGWDATARVWDAPTGQELLTFRGHTGGVFAVAFSPDGSRLVTGSGGKDGSARVWDARVDRATLTLQGHDDWISSVAISPDGSRVVTGSRDHTARVWDAAGRTRLTLKGSTGAITSVAFSPDGRRVTTGCEDNTAAVWDAGTGKRLLTLKGHSAGAYFTGADVKGVSCVVFSPDGRRIATGSWDQTARVWDAVTGKEVLILKGHRLPIASVAFSSDGKRLVTASLDFTARVWNAASGKPLLVLAGNTLDVLSAAFSPDGRRIVTGGADSTIRIWDAVTGREMIPPIEGHRGNVCSVAFSPDGRRIVTGSEDRTAKVWDAVTGQELLVLEGHKDLVTSVAFSADGNRIVTGSRDRTARVWYSEPEGQQEH